MMLYDLLTDRQPQSRSLWLTGLVILDLFEFFEDAVEVLGGNAGAGVGYEESKLPAELFLSGGGREEDFSITTHLLGLLAKG